MAALLAGAAIGVFFGEFPLICSFCSSSLSAAAAAASARGRFACLRSDIDVGEIMDRPVRVAMRIAQGSGALGDFWQKQTEAMPSEGLSQCEAWPLCASP